MENQKPPLERSCRNCGSHYQTRSYNSHFCEDACRREFKVKDGKELGKDYVICQICNRATGNITGIHLKSYHPEWTPESYKSQFPNFPVIASSVLAKITEGSKKAGARMREPEHRKRMSESLKGENNPMHKSKTSDSFRKTLSPFSPEFYMKKDPSISLEKASLLAKEKKDSIEIVSWNKKEYWMEKGYTEEESVKIVSEKQSTFSKEICVKKYGEEEGMKRWRDRQEKWKNKVFNNHTHISRGYSKVGEEFVNAILDKLKELNFKEEILHGKNEKFIKNKENRVYKFDLTVNNSKKIIEFNGDFWHCNPILFESDFFNKPKKMTAEEIWKYDKDKYETAKYYGYSVLCIWEYDYRTNPEETIQKCLDFLLE